MKRFKDTKRKSIFADCKRRETELNVQPDLSYTPAEMFDMWKRGVPINNEHAVNNFYDGDTNPSWDIPIERSRGVDIADVWQSQQTARAKVKKQYFSKN